MSEHGALGLTFALLGLACGALAAFLHGGFIEALGAAAGGFSTLGAVMGYAAHTSAVK